MSSLLSLYRFKPVPYISWIIGYEGTGSLFAYLRDKYVIEVFFIDLHQLDETLK